MINLNKLLRLSDKEISGEKVYGITDIGKIRENNEDYFLTSIEKKLFIVSDGMGGHNAGEIASMNATKSVDAHFSPQLISKMKKDPDQIRNEIVRSINGAHQKIHDLAAENQKYKGMGCTIVLALVVEDSLHIGHIGDSRAYLSNGKKMELLTTDHTYVMELVKAGKMRMEEIKSSAIKNHLSQALGAPIKLIPSYSQHQLNVKDKVLLCSDGLWDCLSDKEIFYILNQRKSNNQICSDLIKRANRAGGYDNITVVVYEYSEEDLHPAGKEAGSQKAGEYGIVFSYPEKENPQE